MSMTKRGFTMVELLIALVLMGIVSTAVYTLLVNNQRLYRQQTQRIELNDNLRSATAILPTDLRELNARDPLGSDIWEMTNSSITYKAMRSLYVTCRSVTGGEIFLDPTTFVGLRGLDAEFDSLLLYVDRDPTLMSDDVWMHVGVTQVQTSNDCGGRPTIKASFTPSLGVTVDSVPTGYPVRGFELVQVLSYVDASGVSWLGARRFSKSSGWSAIQPVVGPLQAGGFRLAYYARDGSVTANPALVARVSITVIGRTSQPVRLNDGTTGYLADSLITQVALRR